MADAADGKLRIDEEVVGAGGSDEGAVEEAKEGPGGSGPCEEVDFADAVEFPDSPVFKGLNVDAGLEEGDIMAETVDEGFDIPEATRSLGDVVVLGPSTSMVDTLADEPAMPEVAPSPGLSLDDVVASGHLDSLSVPFLKPAPFFLKETHFATPCPKKAIAAIAGVLAACSCSRDSRFDDTQCTFSAVDYSAAEHVEFSIFVYRREADAVVEFTRDFGCRALWLSTYNKLIARLYEVGIAPAPAPAARPCTLYAPLPLPDLDDFSDDEDEPSEPSSAMSLPAKCAAALSGDLEVADVAAVLRDCEELVKGAEMPEDVEELLQPAPVRALAVLAGSYKHGLARVALFVLCELSSLVSSTQGGDGVREVFGGVVEDLIAAFKTVFRHGSVKDARDFRHFELYRQALKLICNLCAAECITKDLRTGGVEEAVSAINSSNCCCKTIASTAKVACDEMALV